MTTERTLAQELEIIRRHLIGMWTINDTKAAAVHIENAINQLHSKSAAIESLRSELREAYNDLAGHLEDTGYRSDATLYRAKATEIDTAPADGSADADADAADGSGGEGR
jgi:hypothetical protein